jgi:hypothetical protein
VTLEAPDGRAVLPATRPPEARTEPLVHGEYRRLFATTPYDVVAERHADGSLELVCVACASSAFPTPGPERLPLVGADGWTAPVADDDLVVTANEVQLHERSCFVQGTKHCDAGADTVLYAPAQEGLKAREHTEPVRWMSVFGLAGGSPVILASALDYALSPKDAPHGEAALGLGAVGVGLVAWGLWYLLAPASDDDAPLASRPYIASSFFRSSPTVIHGTCSP